MMGQTRDNILIVDDDALLRGALGNLLRGEGYAVSAVATRSAATEALERQTVQAVVLSIGPFADRSLAFCRLLRSQRRPVAILLLSADASLDAVVAGFEAGADDVLARPYDPRELLARIRALLHRQRWDGATDPPGCVEAAGLTLDQASLSLRLPGGGAIRLTPQEARVLHCLIVNIGRVVTRETIFEAAWGPEWQRTQSNEVDVYIRRLRRKLERDADAPGIATVYGLGYRLFARLRLAIAGPDERGDAPLAEA